MCAIGYDYLWFSLRTFYSRGVFFFFKEKLNRLKTERESIVTTMKQLINKYINEIDPEYDQNRIIKDKEAVEDPKKDRIEYLERRASMRRTSVEMQREIETIEKNH